MLSAYAQKQPRGPNGERLCRWCKKQVPPPKLTFCGEACVHEWRLRTSPGYIRECLEERDKQVCALCKVDCKALRYKLLKLVKSDPEEYVKECRGLKIGNRLYNSIWDADHIVPVSEGGGETGLDNFRTLCLWCHREQTNLLLARKSKKTKEED